MSATPEDSFQSEGAGSRMEVVDVWLEAGREGRTFTYADRRRFGLSLGDLVVVRLRGRRLQGLVTAVRPFGDAEPERFQQLQPVEALVQPAAVDSEWQAWIDAMAASCHTSSFRMLKAALPPGWLGQRARSPSLGRKLWWVVLLPGAGELSARSVRQQALLEALNDAGGGGLATGSSSPRVSGWFGEVPGGQGIGAPRAAAGFNLGGRRRFSGCRLR